MERQHRHRRDVQSVHRMQHVRVEMVQHLCVTVDIINLGLHAQNVRIRQLDQETREIICCGLKLVRHQYHNVIWL